MNKNVLDLINQSEYNFYFLVVDSFLDISLFPQIKNFFLIYSHKNNHLKKLKEQNIPYFCLEEQGINLTEKNSGKLLSHPKVLDYIKNTSSKNKHKIAIIPFKPSAKIDFICKKYSWTNISNPSPVNRFLEDKIKFVNFCQENKLPVTPSFIDNFNLPNFQKYQQQLGSSLVIQTHFGWAGNSTFKANSWEEIKNQIPKNALVKYTTFLKGYSLLNNCCQTKHGLLQSPPAIQYTGLPDFTQNPFATVGRQWPSFVPLQIQEQIKDITEKFSTVINKMGYKGFFGLDFLVSDNQVFLLECNPRLTASFDFYTQMEIKNNVMPLFFFHIAEFINIDYPLDIKKEDRFYNSNLVGSELIKRDANNNTIEKINRFSAFSVSYSPIKIKPSVYKLFTW